MEPVLVIFAVNRASRGTHWELDYVRMKLSRHGIKEVIPAHGCYKGKTERSYCVVARNESELLYLINFAFANRQESVLLVNKNRDARLHYININSTSQVLGKFMRVPGMEAMEREGWTLVGDKFYTIA